jgi:hypothetical protein
VQEASSLMQGINNDCQGHTHFRLQGWDRKTFPSALGPAHQTDTPTCCSQASTSPTTRFLS